MCDVIRSFMNAKILLLLLVTSLSGNAFLAYKLTLISEQLGMLQGDQQRAREIAKRSLENMSSTKLIDQKPIKFQFNK